LCHFEFRIVYKERRSSQQNEHEVKFEKKEGKYLRYLHSAFDFLFLYKPTKFHSLVLQQLGHSVIL